MLPEYDYVFTRSRENHSIFQRVISIFILLGCKDKGAKQLTILGTVHFPTSQLNKDSVNLALLQVQPQVILMERDSVSFDANFKRKEIYEENEDLAVVVNSDKASCRFSIRTKPSYY